MKLTDKENLKDIFISDANILFEKVDAYNRLGRYDDAIEVYDKFKGCIREDDICLANKLLNEYEIASKKIILQSKPRILYIMLTNICNLKCVMCHQRREPEMHIPREYLKEILALSPWLERIIWQGGEILILPYFKQVLEKFTVCKNIRHSVVTNFQTGDDGMINVLGMSNLDLTVSIDGASKETYEKIRVGASYELLVSNIKKFNNFRERSKSHIFLMMHFVIMKDNCKDIVDIVEFAHKYKFDKITYIYVNAEENCNINTCNDDDLAFIIKAIDSAKQKAKDYNIIIDDNSALTSIFVKLKYNCRNIAKKEGLGLKSMLFCHEPWHKITLDTGYRFSPDCRCLAKESYVRGERMTVMDIWNSSLMQHYRKKIISGDTGDICSKDCCLSNGEK